MNQYLTPPGYRAWVVGRNSTRQCDICELQHAGRCASIACTPTERANLGAAKEWVAFLPDNPMGLARGAALILDEKLEGMV